MKGAAIFDNDQPMTETLTMTLLTVGQLSIGKRRQQHWLGVASC